MKYGLLNLEDLREENQGRPQKPLFLHQQEAIAALNKLFPVPSRQTKGGLLVLPTGAGKTFTAVKWLGDYVLPKNIKILWLAHTFHLLDQAHETFYEYAPWMPERRTLNIRLISSHPSHDKVASIQSTDDIVIMTTQTAISNLELKALDQFGKTMTTNLRKFIENCRETGLLLILDEAHHAPAYGCRNLLMTIRSLVPNLYLLGLTATPTYTDETRRGWLAKIFDQGVIYEVKQADLIARHILAQPKFIEMSTGREFEVDDKLYNRLMREHKDLPEEIVDKLANDSARNDYIVHEYVTHREKYGKTIIFADRWFQCVYLKEKLLKAGVKADAVYSHIDADPGSAQARNQRTSDDNKRILEQFKYGVGSNALDVLINVRMLTEGTDVPSVKTVFVTRQTTSAILMTQMIGRALRGRKAGGGVDKTEANIVLFVDQWKQLINWATPILGGDIDDSKPPIRGYYPIEYISIRLIEELSKQINLGYLFPDKPFSQILPVGWYQTEISVSTSEGNFDEIQSFSEFVMVYEHTRPKFEKFMDAIAGKLVDEWAKEYLSEEWTRPQIAAWIDQHFDRANDNIGNTLELDLLRMARHLAQKQTRPIYHPFAQRDAHDLDKVAEQVLDNRWHDFETDVFLRNLFAEPGSLWKSFYKSYDRFKGAFNGVKERKLYERVMGSSPSSAKPKPPEIIIKRELTELEKERVKRRDNYTCQACGAGGRGIRLQIDHITPVKMGGEATIDNSQTLCSVCNREKGINEINFRITSTQLSVPKKLDLLPRYGQEDVRQSITRLVNFFYHCQAVSQVQLHKRSSGAYYSTWQIELYPGNDPEWLLSHKQALLKHIQQTFRCPHVRNIKVVA